jgi:assimilatory nitrate reductase catalytic subunit
VEVHPDTAAAHGIIDGAAVRVTTRRAHIVVPALVTSTIRPDTIFVPYHWGPPVEANQLTVACFDPKSWIPNYKSAAARIARTDEPLGVVSAPPVSREGSGP